MKNRKNQSGFGHLGLLIVALVLMLVSAAGYVVYNRNNKKDSSVTATQQSTKANETKAQQSFSTYTYSSNDYVGWKEYCSKTEKACFNYPSSWVLTDNNAGRDVDGSGNKITSDMESISIKAPGTQYFTIGVEWNNYISGLGGACVEAKDKAEVLSYEKISSRPSDYIVEYTSQSSEGKAYSRLLNYNNSEPKIGLTDGCVNTFYYFFKGKNLTTKDILFESRGTDQASRALAKKVIQSFRYQ